ncbi:hypothetical protein [Aureimonas glaciei]|jgi:hypothetical protein|uniref:Uncharacterized protein n=1 Tax=Aureimonas glaciei TaxID=1776957 RepID=A0A917D9A1_9HYPH|nr:hypothetical protein [Aureimonas glaciei]GGD12817.1 hypothetical protein GCM10011335_14560 [Aureimonas glaciei]
MKFRNNDEFTLAGKLAVGFAMLAGVGLLGSVIAFAPPSEIEKAREVHDLNKAEKERANQEAMAREYSRRLNGG